MNPESDRIAAEFWQDLDLIRKKFPMVLFDVWTPDDFVNGEDGMIGDPEGENVDWTDPCHCATVAEITDQHDANIGVNWDVIHQCRMLPDPHEAARRRAAAEKERQERHQMCLALC